MEDDEKMTIKRREGLVSIVIVNLNGGEVFRDCIKSLKKVESPRWELIVIDNGSTDGSENMVLEYSLPATRYKLIKNKTNVGFARANNQGYKYSRGKYILLLNNDTKVDPNFLYKMTSYIQRRPSVGVIQPKIRLMDKPNYLDNAGAFLTRTGFLRHWGFLEKDGLEFNKERMVFSVKGACMLIRRELIEKIGLFDEDFISYMEESDFCWRAWITGYKVMYFPGASIYHKVGFTSKKQSQIYINYHSFKNRIASMMKNMEFRNLVVIGGFHLTIVIGLGVYYLFKLQFSKSKMIGDALMWNMVSLSKLLRKRKEVQSKRILKDKEIFKLVLRKTDWKEMFSHFAKVEANF